MSPTLPPTPQANPISPEEIARRAAAEEKEIAATKDVLNKSGLEIEMGTLDTAVQKIFLQRLEVAFQNNSKDFCEKNNLKTKEQLLQYLLRFETADSTRLFDYLLQDIELKLSTDPQLKQMAQGITEKLPKGFLGNLKDSFVEAGHDMAQPLNSVTGSLAWIGLLATFGYVGADSKKFWFDKTRGAEALLYGGTTAAILSLGKPMMSVVGGIGDLAGEGVDFLEHPWETGKEILGLSEKITIGKLFADAETRSSFLPKEINEINAHILDGDNYMFAPSQIRTGADFVYQTSNLEMSPDEMQAFITSLKNKTASKQDLLRYISTEARKNIINKFMLSPDIKEKNLFLNTWKNRDNKQENSVGKIVEKLSAGKLNFTNADKPLSELTKKEVDGIERNFGDITKLAIKAYLFLTILLGVGKVTKNGVQWAMKQPGRAIEAAKEKWRRLPSAKEVSKDSKKMLRAIFLNYKIIRIPPFPKTKILRFKETLKELQKAKIIDKDQVVLLESNLKIKKFFEAFNNKGKLEFLDGPLSSVRINFWKQINVLLKDQLQNKDTNSPYFTMLDQRKTLKNRLNDKTLTEFSVTGEDDDQDYKFTEIEKSTSIKGLGFKAKSSLVCNAKGDEIFSRYSLEEKNGEMFLVYHRIDSLKYKNRKEISLKAINIT